MIILDIDPNIINPLKKFTNDELINKSLKDSDVIHFSHVTNVTHVTHVAVSHCYSVNNVTVLHFYIVTILHFHNITLHMCRYIFAC